MIEYQNVEKGMVNMKRQSLPEIYEDELITKFKDEEGCIMTVQIPALQVMSVIQDSSNFRIVPLKHVY